MLTLMLCRPRGSRRVCSASRLLLSCVREDAVKLLVSPNRGSSPSMYPWQRGRCGTFPWLKALKVPRVSSRVFNVPQASSDFHLLC